MLYDIKVKLRNLNTVLHIRYLLNEDMTQKYTTVCIFVCTLKTNLHMEIKKQTSSSAARSLEMFTIAALCYLQIWCKVFM